MLVEITDKQKAACGIQAALSLEWGAMVRYGALRLRIVVTFAVHVVHAA
jgi:hypothetical protein